MYTMIIVLVFCGLTELGDTEVMRTDRNPGLPFTYIYAEYIFTHYYDKLYYSQVLFPPKKM